MENKPAFAHDLDDVMRLGGELNALHNSYRVQSIILNKAREDFMELEERTRGLNEQIAHQAFIIERLKNDIAKQEPRLIKLRQFLDDMAALAQKNGRDPASG